MHTNSFCINFPKNSCNWEHFCTLFSFSNSKKSRRPLDTKKQWKIEKLAFLHLPSISRLEAVWRRFFKKQDGQTFLAKISKSFPSIHLVFSGVTVELISFHLVVFSWSYDHWIIPKVLPQNWVFQTQKCLPEPGFASRVSTWRGVFICGLNYDIFWV